MHFTQENTSQNVSLVFDFNIIIYLILLFSDTLGNVLNLNCYLILSGNMREILVDGKCFPFEVLSVKMEFSAPA